MINDQINNNGDAAANSGQGKVDDKTSRWKTETISDKKTKRKERICNFEIKKTEKMTRKVIEGKM